MKRYQKQGIIKKNELCNNLILKRTKDNSCFIQNNNNYKSCGNIRIKKQRQYIQYPSNNNRIHNQYNNNHHQLSTNKIIDNKIIYNTQYNSFNHYYINSSINQNNKNNNINLINYISQSNNNNTNYFRNKFQNNQQNHSSFKQLQPFINNNIKTQFSYDIQPHFKSKTESSYYFNPQVQDQNHQFDIQLQKKKLKQTFQLQKNRSQFQSRAKLTTRKKIIYQPVQKQIIHYPQFMKDPTTAREMSIIPLAKKGVIVKYDAKFQPLQSNLIYEYAEKKSELKNPFINYRQNTQSKPISNYANTTQEKLSIILEQKRKQNVQKACLQSFQLKKLINENQKICSPKSISTQQQYYFKNSSESSSPIRLFKKNNSNLPLVNQQPITHLQQESNQIKENIFFNQK